MTANNLFVDLPLKQVIIYEATYILDESGECRRRKCEEGEDDDEDSGDDVKNTTTDINDGVVFVRAVRATELFSRPKYIKFIPLDSGQSCST